MHPWHQKRQQICTNLSDILSHYLSNPRTPRANKKNNSHCITQLEASPISERVITSLVLQGCSSGSYKSFEIPALHRLNLQNTLSCLFLDVLPKGKKVNIQYINIPVGSKHHVSMTSGGFRGGHNRRTPPLNDNQPFFFFLSSFVSEWVNIRLRYHERASKTLKLPGPLSGPWTPFVRYFTLRGQNVRCVYIIFCTPSS